MAENENLETKTESNEVERGDEQALVFEDWVKEQDEPVKNMLDGHTKGLKSALVSERENRKSLEKQLRELATKAEKGSEAEQRLTQLADELTEESRRADFNEAAHAAGVTNLKLAYLAAIKDDLFDRKGEVNFEGLKKVYPELFGGRKLPRGDAGTGRENGQPASADMNQFIRRSAGR